MSGEDGMLVITGRKHTQKPSTTKAFKKKRSTKKVSAMVFEGDEGIHSALNKLAKRLFGARKDEKVAQKEIIGSRVTILALMKQLKRKEKTHFEGIKYTININETTRTHASASRVISFFNRKGEPGKKHIKKLIKIGAVKFDKKLLEAYCEMHNITLPKGWLVDNDPIINVDVEQIIK